MRAPDNAVKAAAKAKLDAATVDGLTLGGHAVMAKLTLDGYKFVMDDGGWLLVRFSGTEPLIRIYTETTDAAAVEAILADGRTLAGPGLMEESGFSKKPDFLKLHLPRTAS